MSLGFGGKRALSTLRATSFVSIMQAPTGLVPPGASRPDPAGNADVTGTFVPLMRRACGTLVTLYRHVS